MKSKKESENSSKNSKNKKQDSKSHRSLLIIAGILFVALIVAATTIPREGKPTVSTTTMNTQRTTTTIKSSPDETSSPNAEGIKVEVYHFHRTSQCWSCKTLGALAEKTVNTYFKNELESGKLKFGHINVELAQNSEITNRYGATGSSLMIGVYKEGKFTKEEDTKVWYKLNNEEDYMTYLKGVIDSKLKG